MDPNGDPVESIQNGDEDKEDVMTDRKREKRNGGSIDDERALEVTGWIKYRKGQERITKT